MNTTTMLDNNASINNINPGELLSRLREQKGYTPEFVANKLHLRVRVIQLIENNEFNALPGSVFVKGYLRAYAKLLGVSPDPYLNAFKEHYDSEKKPERALWQSKRESNKAEYAIRWFTVLFALGVLTAVTIWWQRNTDNQQQVFSEAKQSSDLSFNKTETTELKLTDISKMQTLLQPKLEISPAENIGDR